MKIKTATFITGASGGLGKASLEMAQNLETDIIITTDLEKPTYTGDKIINFALDVRKEETFQNIKVELEKRNIRVKFLINNAGIFDSFPLSESTEAQLDNSLKVNLYGPILAISTFLNHLIETKGRVVQISSVSVKLPILFMPYANTKVALEAFSTSMRQELLIHGVKLILIRPGAMNTDLIHSMKNIQNPNSDSTYSKEFDQFMHIAQKDVGKMVSPSKVAKLIYKSLTAKKPKKIYSINKNRKIGIVLLFPIWLRDKLIVSQVKGS